MEPSRIDFGSRFKLEREARHLSLGDVARVTKIPERSLERLEGGRFDELPAEVFVRGFVRSYARAVGLDPDDMARRYGELVQSEPKAEASLAGAVKAAAARAVTTPTPPPPRTPTAMIPVLDNRPAAPVPAAPVVSDAEPTTGATVAEAFVDEGIVVVHKGRGRPQGKKTAVEDEMRTLSKAILDAGRETRRLPLTLAVIILVIVATLTMSLLLNRPSHIGDGITQRAAEPAQRA
jgi:Helix-turn-helix domain